MKLPKAKTANIVVQILPNETLIYNLSIDQAVCLNDTAAKVFNACDGETTFEELKNKHQLTDEIVHLALDELNKQNLLEPDYVSPFAGMNRREIIRRVGLTTVIALPVISALVAPQASQAASGCAIAGQTCTAPNIFLQGTCCTNLRCNSGNTCENCIQSGQAFASGRCSSASVCNDTCNQPNDPNRRRCCNTQGQATNTYNAATGGTQDVSCLCP